MANKKQTSPQIASIAGALLRNPNISKKIKRVAGSDLSQAEKKQQIINTLAATHRKKTK